MLTKRFYKERQFAFAKQDTNQNLITLTYFFCN